MGNFSRKILAGLLLILVTGTAQADPRGQASLGFQYNGWNAVTALPFNGSEFFAPFFISYAMDPGWYLSGSTAFAVGSYTDSVAGRETQDLAALTASVVTSDFYFTGFGVSNMFELSLNIPTGDPAWENKQVAANIPTLFLGSRYASEGFGMSALYGLSFPSGANVVYGASLGYSYSGPYDPQSGFLSGLQLKMGDTIFLALNRVESFPDNKSGTFRLTAMAFLPTLENGLASFQLGPNGGLSYTFYNPAGFSWNLGAQVYTLAQRYYFDYTKGVVYGLEPYGSAGFRFNFSPSLTLGNWNIGASVQYVLVNGYPVYDVNGLYNGGGFVFGLNPAYYWALDSNSGLSLTGGYNFIVAHDASTGFTDDVDYHFWTLGASYAVKID